MGSYSHGTPLLNVIFLLSLEMSKVEEYLEKLLNGGIFANSHKPEELPGFDDEIANSLIEGVIKGRDMSNYILIWHRQCIYWNIDFLAMFVIVRPGSAEDTLVCYAYNKYYFIIIDKSLPWCSIRFIDEEQVNKNIPKNSTIYTIKNNVYTDIKSIKIAHNDINICHNCLCVKNDIVEKEELVKEDCLIDFLICQQADAKPAFNKR
jgi:hypothetical protein